jgi:fibronectin-binding autotransporter adhesin
VFDQGFDGVYAGSITGSGSLIKSGTGVLTLGGTNAYSGGTLINAGGLAGSIGGLQGLIVNNGALTFNQATDGFFNGLIAGSGTVTKLGAGNLTFASNSAFTGLTTVGQGTLTLNNAALPGSVSVGTQAALAGTGTIGGNLTIGGRLLLPGISPTAAAAAGMSGFNKARSAVILPFAARDLPSMVINGDLVANQGSTMNFTVSAGGAAPILVNGRASLIGTHLNVAIDDPNPGRKATYTALKALGGLSEAGTDAITASTSVLPVVTRAQNSLLITILNLRVPTTGLATTPNGVAAAHGIDAVKNCTSGDICDVVKEVLALDPGDLDVALRGLAGEIHASSLRLLVNDSRSMTDMVRNELSDAEHEAEDNPGGRTRRGGARTWLQFAGEHSSFNNGTFSGGSANVGGGGGGVDFRPRGNVLAGLGAGLSLGSLSLSDISGKSTLKAPRAFGYSGVRFGPFHLHAGSSASKNNSDTNRDVKIHAQVPDENGNLVPLSNGVDRGAASDQNGYTADAWSELQHTRKWSGWMTDSKFGFRATRYVRRAFDETGAGAISLAGIEDVLKSRETHFDFNTFKQSGSWRPRIVLNYLREFGDDATVADVNFQQRPESQFQVTGIPIPRDMFHGLFGLTMRTLSGLEYTVEYETTQASNESHNAVRFRVRAE